MDERRSDGAPSAAGLLERSDVMNELDGTLAGIAYDVARQTRGAWSALWDYATGADWVP